MLKKVVRGRWSDFRYLPPRDLPLLRDNRVVTFNRQYSHNS